MTAHPVSTSPGLAHPYIAETIAAYLDWTQAKVQRVLRVLERQNPTWDRPLTSAQAAQNGP